MAREYNKVQCKRCGAKWRPRVAHPRYCRVCRTPYWDSKRVNRIKRKNRAKKQV